MSIVYDKSKRSNTFSLFENLLTMDELLVMLKGQYSRKTIYKWKDSDGLPFKKIRGRLWFPKDEVICWLERSSM